MRTLNTLFILVLLASTVSAANLAYAKLYIGQSVTTGPFNIKLADLGYNGDAALNLYQGNTLVEFLAIAPNSKQTVTADGYNITVSVNTTYLGNYSYEDWAGVNLNYTQFETIITTTSILPTTTINTTSTPQQAKVLFFVNSRFVPNYFFQSPFTIVLTGLPNYGEMASINILENNTLIQSISLTQGESKTIEKNGASITIDAANLSASEAVLDLSSPETYNISSKDMKLSTAVKVENKTEGFEIYGTMPGLPSYSSVSGVLKYPNDTILQIFTSNYNQVFNTENVSMDGEWGASPGEYQIDLVALYNDNQTVTWSAPATFEIPQPQMACDQNVTLFALGGGVQCNGFIARAEYINNTNIAAASTSVFINLYYNDALLLQFRTNYGHTSSFSFFGNNVNVTVNDVSIDQQNTTASTVVLKLKVTNVPTTTIPTTTLPPSTSAITTLPTTTINSATTTIPGSTKSGGSGILGSIWNGLKSFWHSIFH